MGGSFTHGLLPSKRRHPRERAAADTRARCEESSAAARASVGAARREAEASRARVAEAARRIQALPERERDALKGAAEERVRRGGRVPASPGWALSVGRALEALVLEGEIAAAT